MKRVTFFNPLLVLSLTLTAVVSSLGAPAVLAQGPVNLALNTSRTGYPNPVESDSGWGGGSYPWDMLDGLTAYTDTWAHGLAFTGGTGNWAGQPCGRRQATVNFGAPQTFNRVLVWHHGDDHIPTNYGVEYWDGANWVPAGGTSTVRYDLRSDTTTWGAVPTETIFPAVTGSKVRFWLDNCNITHGWIYQFDVYNDPQSPPTTNLIASTDTNSEIYPGDPVAVNLDFENAVDLYAAQADCTVDPDILAPQSATFGDFFDPVNRLVGANSVDAAAGTWLGAISQRSPAGPLSGAGLFATLNYIAQNPGTTDISCEPLIADRDGFELPVTFTGASVTVIPFAVVNGVATYQGRLDHADINVTATCPPTPTSITDSEGNFELELKTGTCTVTASAPGYLSNSLTLDVASGQTFPLPPTVLKGGSANGDNVIDIGDATLVAANFGLTVPPADARADINGDGRVNVQDLAILGSNYGLSGDQPW